MRFVVGGVDSAEGISGVLSSLLYAAIPQWTNIPLIAQHPDLATDIKHVLPLDETTLKSEPAARN